MKGQIIIISGPSGVGKGTLVNELIKERNDFILSISCTTRKRRRTEVDGRDYFFVSEEKFKDMIKNNELIEYANVHGNFYGTPREFVEKNIAKDKKVILEIDIQGGLQIKSDYPESILIFVLPPKISDIKKRILKRGTEDEKEINTRLETAKKELKLIYYYDFYVINDKIEECVKDIRTIIEACEHKIDENILNMYKGENYDKSII